MILEQQSLPQNYEYYTNILAQIAEQRIMEEEKIGFERFFEDDE
jgi:hypothetical protein